MINHDILVILTQIVTNINDTIINIIYIVSYNISIQEKIRIYRTIKSK
jgi:hypothetical protein